MRASLLTPLNHTVGALPKSEMSYMYEYEYMYEYMSFELHVHATCILHACLSYMYMYTNN